LQIALENIGKKFRKEWIFRNVNLQFQSGQSYTFIGPNGSGKSTLLQVLSGILPQTEGKITYSVDNQTITVDDIYKKIVMAAPYLELIEEFTLSEMIDFHYKFKQPIQKNHDDLIELLNFKEHRDKTIKNFSSGMKQRLKLGLAFHSESDIILLDEPTSNLDAQGVEWYLSQVEKYTQNRLLIICSNQPNEYAFCKNIVDIRDFK
jgi:ABC-type multidrug transport system ATPase subunit